MNQKHHWNWAKNFSELHLNKVYVGGEGAKAFDINIILFYFAEAPETLNLKW